MRKTNGRISVNKFKVHADNLLPSQHANYASKFLRSTDSYQQRFIKFDDIGIFHSYCELLYAALLEANPNVTIFIPHPFSLRIGKRKYIPDFYYVESGKRYISELNHRGEFADEMKLPLKEFFEYEDTKFQVISNEAVLQNEQLALNWLCIIRVLLGARFEDTSAEEIRLWESFKLSPTTSIKEIISLGNRIESRAKEIALFRLVHKGKLTLNFNEKTLGLDTEVSLCI